MKIRNMIASLSTTLVFLAAPSAVAAPIEISETGTGFVQKSVTQKAFGWGKEYAANAPYVSFRYVTVDYFRAVCTSLSGINTLYNSQASVSKTILSAPSFSNSGAINGHTLGGFTSSTPTGSIPTVGTACQTDGTWTSVTILSTAKTLFAKFNATEVAL